MASRVGPVWWPLRALATPIRVAPRGPAIAKERGRRRRAVDISRACFEAHRAELQVHVVDMAAVIVVNVVDALAQATILQRDESLVVPGAVAT